MGNFNQIVGPGSGAIPSSSTIVTEGLALEGRGSIDHMELSEDPSVMALNAISNVREGNCQARFGVVAEVSARHFP